MAASGRLADGRMSAPAERISPRLRNDALYRWRRDSPPNAANDQHQVNALSTATGCDHEHSDGTSSAARWLATTHKRDQGKNMIVQLRQRFGLSRPSLRGDPRSELDPRGCYERPARNAKAGRARHAEWLRNVARLGNRRQSRNSPHWARSASGAEGCVMGLFAEWQPQYGAHGIRHLFRSETSDPPSKAI